MTDDRSRDPFQPVQPAAPGSPEDRVRGFPAGHEPFAPVSGHEPLAPAADPWPVQAPPVRSKGSSGMLVNVLLGIALVVAVGGVAFAAGRVTAPPTAAAPRGGFIPGGPTASGAPGGNGGFGAATGGLSLEGKVTAVSADSITLQLASGQSITIPTDAQTTWHQREAATAADVTTGSTVIVQLQGGRGALGQGNGGQGLGPNGSGPPGREVGPASTVTVVMAGS